MCLLHPDYLLRRIDSKETTFAIYCDVDRSRAKFAPCVFIISGIQVYNAKKVNDVKREGVGDSTQTNHVCVFAVSD